MMDPLRLKISGISAFSKERDILNFCLKKFTPPIIPEKIAKKFKKSIGTIKFETIEDC